MNAQLCQRRVQRFSRFSLPKDLPRRKIFKRRVGCEWFFHLLMMGIFLYLLFFRKNENSPHYAIGLAMAAVFGFGGIIRMLLARLFPEIRIDEKGIKYLSYRKILWHEIIKLKTSREGTLNTMFLINGKILKIRHQRLNSEEVRFIRAYFMKYRIHSRSAAVR